MAKHANKGVTLAAWPQADKILYDGLCRTGEVSRGKWSDLTDRSISSRRYGYRLWLGFLAEHHPASFNIAPGDRVTLERIREYVTALRRNCTETTVAVTLQRLHLTIRDFAPEVNWDWLYRIERRIARKAVPLKKSHARSSDLFRCGLDLMDRAASEATVFKRILLRHAERFRDGLMIALLAEAPMRRGTLHQLRIHDHVVKDNGRWQIVVAADMVKTRVEQDYEVSEMLGSYLERYVHEFRPVFENSDGHLGMWPYGERPMTDKMIRRYLCKHTQAYLGKAISPHGFRRAAATTAIIDDPHNVRSTKDLLGHRTFAMTEKHYIVARSRQAGRLMDGLVKGRTRSISEEDIVATR
ncbi:MAG: site-specific integrase [Alphaproteobacteria bacterium]|nr:MAG: site-specific integrase [Alphaproteobacteria bacterium]